MRLGRRGRGSRGAVIVETALVAPLLLILVFGIVEMAMLMKDDVAITSAVRGGGRIASTGAGAGPGDETATSCTQACTPASAPMAAEMAADAVARESTALPRGEVQQLWVYKANAEGYPGAAGNTSFTTCASQCVAYQWNPGYVNSDGSVGRFVYYSGTWASATINACANTPPDAVGVYIQAKHSFYTGLFGTSISLSDHAVFQFEPLPNSECAPGAHP